MKKLLYLIGLFLLVYVLYVGLSIAPGSYDDNIKYYVSFSEKEAILRVNNYKMANNTQYFLSKRGYFDGKDSRNLWYFFYIYCPKRDVILKCLLRCDTKKKTTITIVSFQENYRWYELEKSNKKMLKIVDLDFIVPVFENNLIR